MSFLNMPWAVIVKMISRKYKERNGDLKLALKFHFDDRVRTASAGLGLVAALILCGCAEKPRISGLVRDRWGAPLEGVKVSVEHTRFEALTSSKGAYVVDYVPGDVDLTFSKEGYEPTRASLKIQTAARYPASDIALNLVPPGNVDILILAKQGPELPDNVTMQTRTFQSERQYAVGLIRENHFTWSVDSGGPEVHQQGTLESLERMNIHLPSKYRLFRVGSDGVIFDFWNNLFTPSVEQRMTPIDEQVTTRGDFILHSVDLGPGRYAYVRWMDQGTPGLNGTPIGGSTAYVFVIK